MDGDPRAQSDCLRLVTSGVLDAAASVHFPGFRGRRSAGGRTVARGGVVVWKTARDPPPKRPAYGRVFHVKHLKPGMPNVSRETVGPPAIAPEVNLTRAALA